MKLHLLVTALFVLLPQYSVQAQPTTVLSGAVEVAAAAQSCGRWVETMVEFCDERVVLVDKPVTECTYVMTRGYREYIGRETSRYHDGHVTCVGQFDGGWGVFTLKTQQHMTQQRSVTERYNCRQESRWTWIPGRPGPDCEQQEP